MESEGVGSGRGCWGGVGAAAEVERMGFGEVGGGIYQKNTILAKQI